MPKTGGIHVPRMPLTRDTSAGAGTVPGPPNATRQAASSRPSGVRGAASAWTRHLVRRRTLTPPPPLRPPAASRRRRLTASTAPRLPSTFINSTGPSDPNQARSTASQFAAAEVEQRPADDHPRFNLRASCAPTTRPENPRRRREARADNEQGGDIKAACYMLLATRTVAVKNRGRGSARGDTSGFRGGTVFGGHGLDEMRGRRLWLALLARGLVSPFLPGRPRFRGKTARARGTARRARSLHRRSRCRLGKDGRATYANLPYDMAESFMSGYLPTSEHARWIIAG